MKTLINRKIISLQIVLQFSILFSVMSCQQQEYEYNTNSKEVNPENIIHLSDAELKNIDISYTYLSEQCISDKISTKGFIDVPPQNIYSMSIPLGGYLKSTHLLPGTPIKKSEVIAVLEDPKYIQLQEEYLNTKIQLQALEKNYFRQKELVEQKAVSYKNYEAAAAEYEATKVKLKALEEKLLLINIQPSQLTADKISRTINIYAPFNGYVTKINFSVGKYISPEEVLFELVNPEDIHLNIKVFEKDLEYLKIGQKVVAYTNYKPDKKYICDVILINKTINPDRTIDVHCHFQEYDHSLIPGTYMVADIFIDNKKTYTLPLESVVFYNNNYYVFVAKSTNDFEMVNIQHGIQTKTHVEIKDYQKLLSKKIVSKSAYALLMKLKNTEEE